MTTFTVCAVRDHATDRYHRPFTAHNNDDARRQFIMACHEKDSMLSSFPNDYALYQVGRFNDLTGTIESCNPPVLIAWASEFKIPNSDDDQHDLFEADTADIAF